MLQRIKLLSSQRLGWVLLAISAIALLSTALYFQYQLNIQPCIKCIYIRAAFSGILLAALLGMLSPGNAFVRVLALFGALSAAVFGLVQANDLLHIEQVIATGGFSSCSFFAEFPSWMPLDQWLPSVFEPRGSCGEDSWRFLNHSMAFWTAVTLYGYIAVCGLLLLSQFVRISNNPYKG